MATYPTHIVSFVTHNPGDTVSSADPNTIQNEIVAVETILGTNPHVSTTVDSSSVFNANATTYTSLSARLANIEKGITGDSHSQYVHKSGGDTITPAAATVGLTIQAASSPTANLFQVTDNGGTPKVYVDSNLVLHSVNSGGTPVDATASTNAQGTSSYLATVDHKHRGGIAVVTSGTRPGSPYQGQFIYETDTDLIRRWNGTEWWCFQPNGTASRQFPSGTTTTTSTTYVNSPAGISAVAFTKNNINSTLRVTMAADCYVTAGNPCLVTFGVQIGATDYAVGTMNQGLTNEHHTMLGVISITGIAAGAVSIQPRWKVASGDTAAMNTNDAISIIVDEI